MNKSELIKEYGNKIDEKILLEYVEPEEYLMVNEMDNDLHPIRLDLPNPPEYHKIDGFGLPAKHQYFRRPVMPDKLKDLVKSSQSIDEIWTALDNNRTTYRNEIIWLNHMWYYRLYGYWFFNNGMPTYIDGWHWMYVSFWNLDIGLPEYRHRDRLFFLFARYCYTTTTATFFWRIQDDDGDYQYFSTNTDAIRYCQENNILRRPEKGEWEIDYGRRTCLGFNYPKHRREGATYKGCLINYEIISRLCNAHGGIQSMTEMDAKKKVFFDKIIKPFKRLPFFFIPEYSSSLGNPNELVFDIKTARRLKGSSASFIETGLESKIDFGTSNERDYDGDKLFVHHGDEVGKGKHSAAYNLLLRHDVVKKCLAQGTEIHGLKINTSTVSETKEMYGYRYMKLCRDSHWEQRNPVTGQTKTGLFNLFIPATINWDGFTDKYGNPVIDDPDRITAKYIRKKIGAKRYLDARLADHKDNPSGYYEEIRENPTKFRHCFLTSQGDSGFNLSVIAERLVKIDMGETTRPRVIDFYRDDKGLVQIKDNIDGKFIVSYIPPNPNSFYMKNGVRYPANHGLFYASADPFRVEKVKGGNRSDGGGAVFMDRDVLIDSDSKDVSEWITNRFVCTYLNRVATQDEFCEDMLMMCEFYGCKMFPENNIDEVDKYFEKVGKRGYLQYIYNKGKRADRAGWYASHTNKQEMFSLMIGYIERHGMSEQHREILEDCRDIQGLDDTRNFDRFVACGGCLMARRYDISKNTRSGEGNKEEDDLVEFLLSKKRRI